MSTSRINRTGRVLVATSGSAASESAITFPARTAASRGLPLELVHVLAPLVCAGPYDVTPDAMVRDVGRRVLAHGEDGRHHRNGRHVVTGLRRLGVGLQHRRRSVRVSRMGTSVTHPPSGSGLPNGGEGRSPVEGAA
jgi:hypothetical protein